MIAFEHASGTPSDPDAPRHWRASYYPVVAPDGERLGVGVVVEEITERRRAEQLAELQYTATRILADASTFDEAVPGLLEAICTVLDWTVACYWSVDPDDARLTWAQPDADLAGFRALTERAVLSTALLPGRVAASGRSEWIADLEPERFPRAPVAVAEGLRSGVAFPVLVDGEVAGVIEAFVSARRAFDHELVPMLEAIGVQLGQFIRRMRVEDERSQLLLREQQARAEAEAAAATLRKLERVSDAALQNLALEDLLNALLAADRRGAAGGHGGDPPARRRRPSVSPSDGRARSRA